MWPRRINPHTAICNWKYWRRLTSVSVLRDTSKCSDLLPVSNRHRGKQSISSSCPLSWAPAQSQCSWEGPDWRRCFPEVRPHRYRNQAVAWLKTGECAAEIFSSCSRGYGTGLLLRHGRALCIPSDTNDHQSISSDCEVHFRFDHSLILFYLQLFVYLVNKMQQMGNVAIGSEQTDQSRKLEFT